MATLASTDGADREGEATEMAADIEESLRKSYLVMKTKLDEMELYSKTLETQLGSIFNSISQTGKTGETSKAPPTTTPTPPPPTTTAAPPVENLSVFGSSLPAVRPQSLAELPRQRPKQQQQRQQQQQQQQQKQQQPSRFQTQFNQNPRQQFAPQPPPRQRVVQQPLSQARHPEEFLNRLTEEDKTKFLQQFSFLNVEQQQYAYNQFLSTPANVQQFAIKQFLSLDPEVLVFSIQTEIDSERGVQPQQQNPQPPQPQQQQQGQRFNDNNQQPRQLSGADARALQQQENALNDIIALQNSLNFPNQS